MLSLPKQLVLVYMGVALEAAGTGAESRTESIVKDVLLVVTIIATVLAMRYIRKKMDEALPKVVYDRQLARKAKMQAGGFDRAYDGGSYTDVSVSAAETSTYDDPYQPRMAAPAPVPAVASYPSQYA